MSKKKNNIAVIVPSDQVTSLNDLAKDLAKYRDWKRWKVLKDEIHFWPEDRPGLECCVDTSGFAFYRDGAGEWVPSDEDNVDWDQEFDAWSNHVWAEDANGNTVMLHD